MIARTRDGKTVKALLRVKNKYGEHYYPVNCKIKFQDGKMYEIDEKGTLRRIRP